MFKKCEELLEFLPNPRECVSITEKGLLDILWNPCGGIDYCVFNPLQQKIKTLFMYMYHDHDHDHDHPHHDPPIIMQKNSC